MAFAQIATSVTILSSGLIGYKAITFEDYLASTASNIAAGSSIEIAGAYFKADSAVTPNASSWTAITTATTAYLTLAPSGSAGSQILTAAWQSGAPVFSHTKQAWYTSSGSNIRVIAACYKTASSKYGIRTILDNNPNPYHTYSNSGELGPWNMDSTIEIYLESGVAGAKIRSVRAFIITDADATFHQNIALSAGGYENIYTNPASNTTLGFLRLGAGVFDDAVNFASTAFSRGYYHIEYIA